MDHPQQRFQKFIATIVIAFFVSTIFAYADWSAPPEAPPGCPAGTGACYPPINVSGDPQDKLGGLGVGLGGTDLGLVVYSGSILAQGTQGITPTSGAGTRFMWIPAKGAIRAGSMSNDQWDDMYIGAHSIAMGRNSNASGITAIAFGNSSKAVGSSSIAMGYSSYASNPSSVAMGHENTVSSGSLYGVAIGAFNRVTGGTGGVALGGSNNVTGNYAVALGSSNTASGWEAVAIGKNNVSSSQNSIAIGRDNVASVSNSMALGNRMTVQGMYSVGIGISSTTAYTLSQPGIMAIMGGNVGIGTVSPTSRLTVYSTVIGGYSAEFKNAGSAKILIQGGGSNTSSTIDIKSSYTVADEKTWVLGVNGGDPNFSIRTLNDAGTVGFSMMTFTRSGVSPGNVGIGVLSPSQKLDVAGYVRGSTGLCIVDDCRTSWPAGGSPPPASVIDTNENVRIIRGTIGGGNGCTAFSGSGYTLTYIGVGRCQVNFTTPFSSPPTVVTTLNNQLNRADHSVEILAPTSSSVEVRRFDPAADIWLDLPFYFIAVGPQ